MTYKDALQFLWDRLPMFQRDGKKSYKADIGNIVTLCQELDSPHLKVPCIHIAGTNGKGTCSHILAALLQNKYSKVGLYTSPHYSDFRERIKVNGTLIPKRSVAAFVHRYQKLIDSMDASFFEITVAMAFWYFAKVKADFSIIEVGLGGRLDSTNIVFPELSIITNISLDHTDLLGNTIEKIAKEKAGIIKQNTPVLIGEQQKRTAPVFKRIAAQQKSPIYYAKDLLNVRQNKTSIFHYDITFIKSKTQFTIKAPLSGPFQFKNMQTAIGAYLLHFQISEVSKNILTKAFKDFQTKMHYKGRWQILNHRPLTIADSGHNESGLQKSVAYLKAMKVHKHIVLGFVKDKNWKKLLAMFPLNSSSYYLSKPQIARGLDLAELSKEAHKIGLDYKEYNSVTEAYKVAKINAKKTEIIFIGGSTFVVAELV